MNNSSRSKHQPLPLLVFVAIALAAVYVLAGYASAWARPNHGTLPGSIPTPTPGTGLGFSVYNYQATASTGEMIWFTALAVNNISPAFPLFGGNIASIRMSNFDPSWITVTQGTLLQEGRNITWSIGSLFTGEPAYCHISGTVVSGDYQVIADGRLVWQYGVKTSTAVVNPSMPVFPGYPVHLPVVLSGFGPQ